MKLKKLNNVWDELLQSNPIKDIKNIFHWHNYFLDKNPWNYSSKASKLLKQVKNVNLFSFLVISKLKLFHPHFKFSASADFTNLESEQSKETRKELASAFCAIAELYMTDLCDNPEAEHECSESVRKAIEADAKSPEAWQTKARLHLIKSEFEEAKNNLNQSLNLWLPTYQAVLENRYDVL